MKTMRQEYAFKHTEFRNLVWTYQMRVISYKSIKTLIDLEFDYPNIRVKETSLLLLAQLSAKAEELKQLRNDLRVAIKEV